MPHRGKLLCGAFSSVAPGLIGVLVWSSAVADDARHGVSSLTGRCRNRGGVMAFVAPARPRPDAALRVLFLSERPRPGATVLGQGPKTGGRSERHALQVLQRGGPPYWWMVTVERPVRGRHRFALVDEKGRAIGCARPRVRPERKPEPGDDVWPVRRKWNRAMENLYAAWIEKLFDAPAGARVSWSPLHEVLRDRERNLLYNHLGSDEDGPDPKRAVVVEPDCADLPYFLRAYFAWKLRLPFGYRHCDRGSSKRPTRCGELRTNVGQLVPQREEPPAKTFSRFIRRKVSYVHSGSGRTAPDDDQSDLYPVRLSRRALRPGTVYVDPYGHLLIVSKWVEQTERASGMLYAVDGHPDLSVGRKRFWRGAFMFKADIKGGAGGFKVWRPLEWREEEGRERRLVALTNEEIDQRRQFVDPSSEQYRLGLEGFYDRMERVINPRPLSPTHAYRERLTALFELIQERVDSVKAGERYMREQGYKVVQMPAGPRIFETRGPWEDYSTPARDMRLLIAIEDVLQYPQKVVRKPKWFALEPGQSPQQAKGAMEQLRQRFTAEHAISYLKSDGSEQRVSMAEVIARRGRLEVAYNPNDCIEIRWGASGDELSSCKRRAPEEQQKRMARYRSWFASRTRPPIR